MRHDKCRAIRVDCHINVGLEDGLRHGVVARGASGSSKQSRSRQNVCAENEGARAHHAFEKSTTADIFDLDHVSTSTKSTKIVRNSSRTALYPTCIRLCCNPAAEGKLANRSRVQRLDYEM